MLVKRAIGYVPGLLGYEIRRKQPQLAESVLAKVDLGMVLDVGANTGQFSLAVHSVHSGTTIHAFEPIPEVFATLQKSFQGNGNMLAHNLALSDTNSIADFEVNESSASSSLLPLGETHKQTYPGAQKTRKIQVTVRTLDSWGEGLPLKRPLLLKLDVQGNELKVLRGALTILPYADYVLTEVNMGSMYEGQAAFRDIHQMLSDFDLNFVDFFPEKRCPDTHKCLFGDALFARSTVH